MEHEVAFEGILNNEPSSNHDFYNWNRVKVQYCDAASFSGYVENTIQNRTTLFFRGRIMWESILKELFSIGLANAKKHNFFFSSSGSTILIGQLLGESNRGIQTRSATKVESGSSSFQELYLGVLLGVGELETPYTLNTPGGGRQNPNLYAFYMQNPKSKGTWAPGP